MKNDSHMPAARYVLDAVGNRIEETLSADGRSERAIYRYAPGTNRLIARIPIAPTNPLIKVAARPADSQADETSGLRLLAYRSDGLPRAEMVPTRLRHLSFDDGGRLVGVATQAAAGGKPQQVRYAIGLAGERIARRAGTQTTYSLYSDQRLAMETDGAGRITRHYLYLEGRPVARIDIGPAGDIARYALHTDSQGTVLAVTDDTAQLVWAAQVEPFGTAHVQYARLERGVAFEQPLRLPGQRVGAATGLADNYHRTYDPASGRYLEPDPLGAWAGGPGPNPYVYVGANPMAGSDSLGLYEAEIHYYMTFFLAAAAGLSADDARIMALAAQYIDDNPDTAPVILLEAFTEEHRRRLLSYHFALVPSCVGEDGLVKTKNISDYGWPPNDPSYANPTSAQLDRLLKAVTTAGSDTAIKDENKRGAQLQLLGEYLHALEDTYARRTADNYPIGMNAGLGHLFHSHNPDYTYNHWGFLPYPQYWGSNEDRTLAAELKVFDQIRTTFDLNGAARIGMEELEGILRAFNAVNADINKVDPGPGGGKVKADILAAKLAEWVPGLNRTD